MIKRYFFIVLMCIAVIGGHAKTVTYTADNTTDFCNPERGFYDHVEWTIKSDQATTNLSSGYLTGARNNNRTLILRLYYLDNYRTKDIPQNILTQIGNDMALLRQYGCKAILRFAYTASSTSGDGTLEWWEKHLDQLKPILAANADVIYVVQAGFLGEWGEWYYSSYGKGTAIPSSVKTSLLNKLLECVPTSRYVQVRTPKFKKDYTGSSSAMTASDAYKNTAKGRLGHHNDAFLKDETNSGTYTNRTTDMAYIAAECLYVPNGGETNMESGKTAYDKWAKGTIAEAEMAQLHYSYLNAGYSEFVTDQWREEGAFARMSRNLGYRYQLTTATLPETGAAGKKITVQLNIKNVGYAPLYNERHAYLVFKSSSKTYTVQLASDPRTWQPNGATTAISETVTLPSTMAAGTYTMYLWLPDAAASIADKADFAVRFANSNTWDSTTGYNKLNHTITVTADGGEQGGDDDDDPTPTTPCEYTVDLSTAQTWSGQSEGASVNFSTTNKVLTANYSTAGSWLATGLYFPINQSNIEEIRISFKGAVTADSWTAFEVCLTDGTNIYRDNTTDFSLHGSSEWQTASVVPNSILWTEPEQAASISGVKMTGIILIINPAGTVSAQMQVKDLTLKLKCTSTDSPYHPLTEGDGGCLKIIKDNRLYILRNGKMYNALGI
ncbi:MAG: DUF4832 domain-containing protein [Paludibacteraceae bacterium]|nr:DUF4832 domain-containing protein [Paludibacteraceae bacterium]